MAEGSPEEASGAPSIARGIPLEEEPGLGALTLPGFLREVTEAYAEREALVLRTAEGATRWTYADLWERALEVARALRACGVGKDGRVGVLMTNRPEWLAAVFGTSLAGGVAVPLSTFSTPPELAYLLQASGVSVLLLERDVGKRDFAAALRELDPAIAGAAPEGLESATFPHLRRLALVGEPLADGAIESWEAFLARGKGEPRELVVATGEAVQPSDRAALFFSSGSTSRPKGILNAHRGIAIQLWRFRRMYGFGPEDGIRCWSANGFFWSGNFGMALGTTLASGGTLVLQRTFDAAEALELMQDERVDFPVAWPHQWAQLEGAPNWERVDLSSMRFADSRVTPFRKHPSVSAGEWLEPQAYGNTETFTISTCVPSGALAEAPAGSHGEPLPGNTVKIVDPQTGAVVPRGQAGEIAVKGPTLMLGYLGVPADESLDAEGFFHTGDGGRMDEAGRLFWEGRLSDIIKTGGANVSPVEVDGVLAACPGVKVARTVGVPHETLGEMVVACVVADDGGAPDEEAVRRFAKERLASYKVPRCVVYFAEDELSLTGSAKIKADELRGLAAERLQAARHR